MNPLISAVLCSRELVALIIQNFTHRQAARLRGVSNVFASAVDELASQKRFKPRLLVCCSGANKVLEVDLWTGAILQSCLVRKVKRKRSSDLGANAKWKGGLPYWPTGIAFSPYDGHLYVCQYKECGVLRFSGNSLHYSRLASRSGIGCPEGIAFTHGFMYVCRAKDCAVVQCDPEMAGGQQVLLLPDDVLPWGMEAGPDGNLYVAVDRMYRTPEEEALWGNEADGEYGAALLGNTGQVLRVVVDAKGQMISMATFCGLDSLSRPSGIAFDDNGDMYVTSRNDQVLKFAGPSAEHPGLLLGTIIDLQRWHLPPEHHPFDIVWWAGHLIVTAHPGRKAVEADARVNVFTDAGVLLRSHASPAFLEPNMMALEVVCPAGLR